MLVPWRVSIKNMHFQNRGFQAFFFLLASHSRVCMTEAFDEVDEAGLLQVGSFDDEKTWAFFGFGILISWKSKGAVPP